MRCITLFLKTYFLKNDDTENIQTIVLLNSFQIFTVAKYVFPNSL